MAANNNEGNEAMRLTRVFGIALALMAAICASAPASADVPAGPVTKIGVQYMPSLVWWTISTAGDATCSSAGLFALTNTNPDTVKSAYAALLASYLTARPVAVYYDPATVKTGPCAPAAQNGCCLIVSVWLQ